MRRFLTAVTVLAAAALAAAAPAAAPPSSASPAAVAAQHAPAHDAAGSPPGSANPGSGLRDVQLAAAEQAPSPSPGEPPAVRSIDAARGPDSLQAGVTSVSPLSAPMGDTSNIIRDDNSTQVRAVFDAINAYRAQKGLNPVRYHLSVQDLAQEWSDSIASREVIEHRPYFWTDPRALSPNNGAGEVIAVRWDRDAAQLVEWWKSSPSHNAILTDPRLNVMGVGITFTNGDWRTTPNRYTMWGVVDMFGYTTLPAGTQSAPGGSTSPSPSPTPTSPSPAPPPVNPPGGAPAVQAGAETCAPAARFQPTVQDMSRASLRSAADVVAIDAGGNLVAYPASGGGLGAPVTLGTGFGNAASATPVDWNRDGILDVLVRWRDGRFVLYPGLAAGQFGAPVTLGQSGWDSMTTALGAWCATNRLPQILALDPYGNLYLYPNRGTGDLVQRAALASAVPVGAMAILDVSGDGAEDLVVRRSDGALVLYRSLGQQALVNEARPVVGTGLATTGGLQVLRGLDGGGSLGLAGVRSDGSLAYWPVANGAVGAPRVLASGLSGLRVG